MARLKRWRKRKRSIPSVDDVVLMVRLHDSGVGYGTIAEKFGVSKAAVQNYCKGSRRRECALIVGEGDE